MSSFTEPLVLERRGNNWVTVREMHYLTDCVDSDDPMIIRCSTVYSVPSGYVTDLASIPRIFWTLLGHPAGEYVQSAVLHDYLYSSGIVDRKKADEVFLESMSVLGVSKIKQLIIWSAVRLFGSSAFSKNTPFRIDN